MKVGRNFTSLFFIFIILNNSLLSQSSPVDSQKVNISTLQDALSNVRKIIADFPSNDPAAMHAYEHKNSYALIKCAKILYESARQQILIILQEIDKRKVYWQYQKDHQWHYFLTKNPIKWITGEKQEVEVNNHLETLESYQGELFVLLGLLAESGNVYEQNYKTTFVKDSKKAYEWIDNLLDILARIKTLPVQENILFLARAMRLKSKLERISYFREDILSEIKNTQIPTSVERNLLKYGAVMAGLGLGYNMGAAAQLKNSFNYVAQELSKYIVDPVKKLAEDVLMHKNKNKADDKAKIGALFKANQTTVELAKEFVVDNSKKYGMKNAADINNAIDAGNYEAFQKFLEEIAHKEPIEVSLWHPFKSAEKAGKFAAAQTDYAHGLVLFGQLLGFSATEDLQNFVFNFIEQQKKQYAGIGQIAFLTPAIATAFLAYSGYQKLTAKDYGPLRRALLEINSLFVDQTKPLNDEQYGKMIYLLYNLKRRVKKELSQRRNLQADFLQDLERVESKEFDSAAKRRIIDDMFRKYSFLGVH